MLKTLMKSEQGAVHILLPLVFLVGTVAGFAICYRFVYIPSQQAMQFREESLKEWERINQQERAAIADLKTLSTEQVQVWVQKVQENSQHFQELQSLIQRRDRQFSMEPLYYLIVSILALLVLTIAFYFISKDANAEAAVTLRNAISVLPALEQAIDKGEARPKLE